MYGPMYMHVPVRWNMRLDVLMISQDLAYLVQEYMYNGSLFDKLSKEIRSRAGFWEFSWYHRWVIDERPGSVLLLPCCIPVATDVHEWLAGIFAC